MGPSPLPEVGDQTTGVCHLTATARAGTDVDDLVIRLVMTHDVNSAVSTTRHAVGQEQACRELRRWMERMCQPWTID